MERDRLDEEQGAGTLGDDVGTGGAGDLDEGRDDRVDGSDEAQREAERVDDEEDGVDEAERLRQENARLRQNNDQLLRMKSNYEQLQDEYDDLLGEQEETRGRRRPVRQADDDDDYDSPRLSQEEVEAIRENPAVAKAFGIMARTHQAELTKLRRELADVSDRARSRDIPLQDEAYVDRLMASGEFKTRRAAHLALQGLRARKAQRERRGRGEERVRRPEREDAQRPPVQTTRRGLTPRQREQHNVVTLSEHARKMDRDGSGYDPKYVARYRAGEVKVVKKR